jgi:hypothetical protein
MEMSLRRKGQTAAVATLPADLTLRWLAPHDGAARALYAQCVRPSLLQYPAYGDMMAARSFHNVHRAVIESGGAAAGMVQILDGTLAGGFFHSISMDGGPAWLPGRGGDDDNAAFFKILAQLYPARATRWRRVIPGVADSPAVRAALTGAGFRHSAGSVNDTIWIDLSRDEAAINADMRKTWRADADKAVKHGLRVEWDDTGRTLPWLLRQEAAARRAWGYRGPSTALLGALARRLAPERGMLTGRALMAGRPVAGVLFALHPPAATWLIGWSGPEGRAHHAHNLLLRDGLRILKQRGISYFDGGGLNDGSARDVKRFKQGLGGQFVTQPGLYR